VLFRSLVFGFRRKEVSVLPIRRPSGSSVLPIKGGANGECSDEECSDGESTTIRPADIYPSVFASLDSVTNARAMEEAGLNLKQFIATGIAAEQLANSDKVREAFRAAAKETVEAATDAEASAHKSDLETIREELSPRVGVSFSKQRDTLLDNSGLDDSVATTLKGYDSLDAFMAAIRLNLPVAKRLSSAIVLNREESE